MNAALDAAAWVVAVSSLARSVPRLLLGVLAVQAARQALATTASIESVARRRGLQVALLRALLDSLHDRHEEFLEPLAANGK